MDILFAPMQGYTDAKYRFWHWKNYGGVKEYYTPFVRLEKGRLRDKDRRDLLPERNKGVPIVPQVIARDREDFARVCDVVQKLGWVRIDLNMGCPFPLQTHAGYGSGLLPHPDRVAAIAEEMKARPEVTFSIKMRLGLNDAEESMTLLSIINEMPLTLVTLHPRLGIQQYTGECDKEAFARFQNLCLKPMVYNGDIRSKDDIASISTQFPQLAAIMIGRGIIDNPDMLKQK